MHDTRSNVYSVPRSTQPSIPPGSVNEYQLRLGRQRQVWLILIADECVGVQVKQWNLLIKCAIPERFCGGDSLRRGAISSVCTLSLPLPLHIPCVPKKWRPNTSRQKSVITIHLTYHNINSIYSHFNYHPIGVNVANFYKICSTISEM